MTDILISPSLDHLGAENLSLKVADSEAEIRAAQRLRYDIFYTEMGAKPIGDAAQTKLDIDKYDAICKHLLVIDSNLPQGQQIVGTYRLLLLEDAQRHGMTLYTESEFDLSKLKVTGKRIMEISRSCVAETHRSKAAINLLWKGIAQYVFSNNVDYLVGVPSLSGTDLKAEHDTLAYLNAFHLAPEEIRPRTVESAYQPLPAVDKDKIDAKRAFMALPPLLKGYLRVGALVGDGAYIDHQFNTIDVVIVMPINQVNDRYFNHYKRHDNNA